VDLSRQSDLVETEALDIPEVIVDFLKTINHKDWHISIEHWGTIPDEGRPASLPPGAPKLVR